MLASTAGFAKGMANWDEDNPQLPDSLTKVLREIRADKERRVTLTSESARQWQRETMDGLEVPSPEWWGSIEVRSASQISMFRLAVQQNPGDCDRPVAASPIWPHPRICGSVPTGVHLSPGRKACQFVRGDGRADRLPVIGSGFDSFRGARSSHYQKFSTG
jgi:hypothetical protein